jgi:hypothetical protein
MSVCPNINLPEWESLVEAVGKIEAYRDFMQTNGEIRTPEVVLAKINNRSETEEVEELDLTKLSPEQLDLFEGQNLNILQTDIPGSSPETSVMSQAIQNDRLDNTVEPEINDHVQALELAQKMSNMLGIDYQTVTADEALKITAAAKNPWSAGDLAFFVGGRVYFVGNNLSMENVFHEFAHPFIRHLQNTNPALIEKLYDQLSQTAQGQEIIAEVTALYPGLDPINGLFKEEALVKALTISGMEKLDKLQSEPKFAKVINEILYAIKQAIRRIFGKASPISKLDASTSLNDLADILVKGGTITLDVEQISQEDVVAYNKERKEFIDELNTVAEGEVQDTINKFAEVTTDHLRKLKADKNYAALRDVLKDPSNLGELEKISANLRAYQTTLVDMADKSVTDIEDITSRSTAMVNSLFRLDIVMDKIHEHLKDIQEEGESQDNLQKGYYYMHLIDHWEQFAAEVKTGLRKNGLDKKSSLVGLVDQINTTITDSKDIINDMYAKGARDVLYAEILPMHQNIKARYDKRIERLRKDGAPQARIDREYKAYHGITEANMKRLNELEAKAKNQRLSSAENAEMENMKKATYDGVAVSPEKIELLLKGELKDANFFNSYLEGYMYNTDPVIGGLASFVKNKMNEVMATAQSKYNIFAKDMQPKLKKAGYNAYRPGDLGETVGFMDEVGIKEDGKITMRKVWTFLNPFKNYRLDQAKHNELVDAAMREYNHSGKESDKTKMIDAIADRKKFQRDYFHQQYTDEYYATQNILYRGEGDTIGKEAMYRRERWGEELRAKTDIANTPSEQLAIVDEVNELFKDYRQMRSRYYLNGELKVDKPEEGTYDASVAERLREHYDATRGFSEWIPKQGVFQNALKAYEQEIIDTGAAEEGSDEFKALRDVWINKNTVRAPLQSYYDSQRVDYE